MFFYPKRNAAIPLPLPEESETPNGATLSQDEIIEKLQTGEIKLSDMTVSEREKYGKYSKGFSV